MIRSDGYKKLENYWGRESDGRDEREEYHCGTISYIIDYPNKRIFFGRIVLFAIWNKLI